MQDIEVHFYDEIFHFGPVPEEIAREINHEIRLIIDEFKKEELKVSKKFKNLQKKYKERE